MAAVSGGKWNTAKQARKEVNALIRKLDLSPADYNIADGSGLSLYNYVSAELEVQLLRFAYGQPDIYNTLLPTLPIAWNRRYVKKTYAWHTSTRKCARKDWYGVWRKFVSGLSHCI